MVRDAYAAQVALLVRLLPLIAEEKVFALKGGTAINLFYRRLASTLGGYRPDLPAGPGLRGKAG
ncbi:hypothetical protein [Rhizobium ruizarguesonis]|uniref:hypothetical protein n=1 Tax=Rhizobium ruizarguesonis TaxID=2081791 RepID=UPI0024798D22|nr:hypothetical protein [Rhizobium ruizarguesonis]